MENYKFKLSVNEHYDATKGKKYNNDKVAPGWAIRDFTWTESSVLELTTQYGISCNEYSTGKRSNENWIGANAIMLDFDNGVMTKERLLAEQANWQFDSYLYSSQNHQKPKEKDGKIQPAWDRLRVLIPLDKTIIALSDLKAVEQVLEGMFPEIDKSFMGQSRYFAHGTTEVSSYKNSKGPLKWSELPGLSEARKTVSAMPSWQKKKETVVRVNDKVLDADQKECLVSDIIPDEPIYCPFCGKSEERGGDGHNAVIKINGDDLPFLFCSSCQSRGQGSQGVYNFHEVDGYIYRMKLSNKLVFIDTLKSKYMGGCEEPGVEGFVCREQGGTEHVKQFCLYHEIPYPVVYPRARYELIFNSDERANFGGGYVNIYDAPELLRKSVPGSYIPKRTDMIHNVIDHVFAHDQQIVNRFYNNLAWFVQTRQKMITSFLMQGVEGTGKGLLFEHVLQQIFGERFTGTADQDAFGNQFNSFLTSNVLVLVNEVSGNFSSASGKNLSTIEKMKIAITDENVQIEGKSKDRYNGKNVCSFLFATNRRDGITLSNNDRRFNVAPRQEVRIQDTAWWPGYEQIVKTIQDQVQDFVWYLKQYPADPTLLGKVIENAPKRVLQVMSQSNAELFFEAVKTGDIKWILENIVKDDGFASDLRFNEIGRKARGLINKDRVSSDTLRVLYNNINGKDLNPVQFGKLAAGHLGTESKPLKIDGKTSRGYEIDWDDFSLIDDEKVTEVTDGNR